MSRSSSSSNRICRFRYDLKPVTHRQIAPNLFRQASDHLWLRGSLFVNDSEAKNAGVRFAAKKIHSTFLENWNFFCLKWTGRQRQVQILTRLSQLKRNCFIDHSILKGSTWKIKIKCELLPKVLFGPNLAENICKKYHDIKRLSYILKRPLKNC